ncbi:MAG TPA: MFS transporter [Candidatus Paceibacterota bacterium]|nr:MFS transporter [Candidatus Paceibacterota bacterium]
MSLAVQQLSPAQRYWRWRIFAITWLAYAGFYLCRKNLSVVMPLMASEQGYSNLQLADVLFGFSLLYALGQFGFGLLADRFGSRAVVGFGMLLAVASNVLMGWASAVVWLALFACLNGAGQSAGWPGLVKNMAPWFVRRERGVIMAWWTTNYVVGGVVGSVFATYVVTNSWLLPQWGWRRGFWIPAFVLLLITVAYTALGRNRPADAGLPRIVESDEEKPGRSSSPEAISPRIPAAAGQGRMLLDWEVWTVALGAMFCKVTRYSFLFWLPLYLTQHSSYGVGEAGYTSSLFELCGFGGALLGGYFSDKVMQSRRLPVAAMMMFGLGFLCWLHPLFATWGRLGIAISIGLIGIMNYGPDTLLQGAASQDIGARWGVGKTSGFIDGVSSVGQLFSAYMVGYVAQKYGWNVVFYLFVVISFLGGAIMATRWNHRSA